MGQLGLDTEIGQLAVDCFPRSGPIVHLKEI